MSADRFGSMEGMRLHRLSWARRWPLAILVLLILAGAAIRLDLSRIQFSHIDDIGVAVSIREVKAHPPTADDLLAMAQARAQAGRLTPRLQLLLDLDRAGLFRPLYSVFAAVYPYVVVPLTWTYAPAQFLLTALLIEPGQDYQTTKLLGRLPSVVFSLLSIVLIAALAFRLGRAGAMGFALAAAAVLTFSGEHATIAALMHSYAATGAASAALLLLTSVDARTSVFDARFIATRALALIGLCYVSYQVVLLLLGYFTALALATIKRHPAKHLPHLVRRGAILGVAVGVGILPAYLFRIRDIRAVHYNAGPSNEFLFEPSGTIWATIVKGLQFFIVNFWIVMKSLVSPVADSSFAATLVTALAAIGLVVGLGRMLTLCFRRHAWTPAAAIGVYCAVALAALLTLVLLGKLALGPTRHNFVYLPVILAPAVYGLRVIVVFLSYCLSLGRPRGAWMIVSALAVVLLGSTFYAGWHDLRSERRDPFNEAELRATAEHYGVDMVLAYDVLQPFAMPVVSQYAPVRTPESPHPSHVAGRDIDKAPSRVLFLAQYSRFDEDACGKLRHWLVTRFRVPAWEPCLADIRRLHAIARPSDVEVEFSRRTRNGTNGLFVEVLELPWQLARDISAR